jgi:hypothetical protein
MALSIRPRVCAAIIKDNRILMVLHDHGDRSFRTLPGGGGKVDRLLFEDTYTYGPDYCFLVKIADEKDAKLGFDPELLPEDQVLKDISWFALTDKKDDKQVKRVIQSLGLN